MAGDRRLRGVLNRYRKQDLLEDVPILLGFESSRLPAEKLQAKSRLTKRELVSSLVDECLKRDVSTIDILDLELNCEY